MRQQDPLELFVVMLSSINSMINPFLYALLGDKFRVYMKKALCCGRGADKGRRYQSGTTTNSRDSTRLTLRTFVWKKIVREQRQLVGRPRRQNSAPRQDETRGQY
ncbi:hypothetical protein Bbelb_270660 [Branchiostoma belcheri]|nr:hypothetical protein Bbelb_270660 [Branchiostoma belcheri]